MTSSRGKRTAARFLADGSSRTSSLLVPFDDLFFDRVLPGGTRRSPVVGLGGASEPQNTGRLDFAALRLLLIIYAASERERYQPRRRSRTRVLHREARVGAPAAAAPVSAL